MALIEAEAVTKRYGSGAATVHALSGVDLVVPEGEFVAILGRSGAGKSTLMNLLAGLDRPTSGRLSVAGRDLAQLDAAGLARYRSETVGIVFQSFHLLPGRTALDNVLLPLVLDGVEPTERRRRATDILESVGLGERLDHTPAQLSGGEQQRVATARALVRNPDLLLCDEPTGNLDSSTADEVLALLRGLSGEDGRTVVMITHEPELARKAAHRLVTLSDGRVTDDEALR